MHQQQPCNHPHLAVADAAVDDDAAPAVLVRHGRNVVAQQRAPAIQDWAGASGGAGHDRSGRHLQGKRCTELGKHSIDSSSRQQPCISGSSSGSQAIPSSHTACWRRRPPPAHGPRPAPPAPHEQGGWPAYGGRRKRQGPWQMVDKQLLDWTGWVPDEEVRAPGFRCWAHAACLWETTQPHTTEDSTDLILPGTCMPKRPWPCAPTSKHLTVAARPRNRRWPP